MTLRANQIERYYDTHEWEGEELSQSRIHSAVIRYLVAVLEWYFYNQQVGIVSELNFYQTEQPKETPKCPDLAVVDGLEEDKLQYDGDDLPSYYVGGDGPPPRIVMEAASRDTWRVDLEVKPGVYAVMKVPEYSAFDPTRKGVWKGVWAAENRLIGWRRDEATGEYRRIEKDGFGRLWSEQLNSWIAMDKRRPRLYTFEGVLRITEVDAAYAEAREERAEAREARRQAETQRLWAEAERGRAEQVQQRLENEQKRAEHVQQQFELEQKRTEHVQQQFELEQKRAEEARQQVGAERLRTQEAQRLRENEQKRAETAEREKAEMAARLAQLEAQLRGLQDK